jgi:hypothetical protein
MPTRAEIADAIRTKNPKFKDLSDVEIEAIVGAQDPRYRDLFNRASGVDPGLGPEKPPDPRQYEAPTSPRQEALMQLQRESTPTPLSVDSAVDALPAAGGMGGGMAGFAVGGPVGAIGGAGAGGSAGEGLRQWIQSKRGKEGPRPLADRAADVVTKGGEQALQEIFGQSVAGVQRAAAPVIYNYALNPSTRLAREYPTMAEDALAARLPISKRGAARAQEAAAAGGRQADTMIAEAEKAGARPIDLMGDIINPMLGDVGPMAENLAKSGLPEGRAALTERIRNAQEEFRNPPPAPVTPPVAPRPLTPGNVALAEQQAQLGPAQSALVPASIFGPTSHEVRTGLELGPQAALVPQRMISGPEPVVEAPAIPPHKPFRDIGLTEGQGIKREMQDQANTAFRSQEAGNEINSVQAAANQAFANKYKTALEDRVAGLAEHNAQTQRDIGVSEGIDAARAKGGLASNIVSGVVAGGAVPAFASGHPWAGLTLAGAGAATKAATSPYALSRTAILLDQLGSHPNLQGNAYRALVEALRQSLAGSTDESSTPQQ